MAVALWFLRATPSDAMAAISANSLEKANGKANDAASDYPYGRKRPPVAFSKKLILIFWKRPPAKPTIPINGIVGLAGGLTVGLFIQKIEALVFFKESCCCPALQIQLAAHDHAENALKTPLTRLSREFPLFRKKLFYRSSQVLSN